MVRLARGFLPRNKNYSPERAIKGQLDRSRDFFLTCYPFFTHDCSFVFSKDPSLKEAVMGFPRSGSFCDNMQLENKF